MRFKKKKIACPVREERRRRENDKRSRCNCTEICKRSIGNKKRVGKKISHIQTERVN